MYKLIVREEVEDKAYEKLKIACRGQKVTDNAFGQEEIRLAVSWVRFKATLKGHAVMV